MKFLAWAVKIPGLGDRRRAMLQDIGVPTGGQVLSEDLGIKLENVTLNDLSSVRTIRIDKDDTTQFFEQLFIGFFLCCCSGMNRKAKLHRPVQMSGTFAFDGGGLYTFFTVHHSGAPGRRENRHEQENREGYNDSPFRV